MRRRSLFQSILALFAGSKVALILPKYRFYMKNVYGTGPIQYSERDLATLDPYGRIKNGKA